MLHQWKTFFWIALRAYFEIALNAKEVHMPLKASSHYNVGYILILGHCKNKQIKRFVEHNVDVLQ